MQQIEIKNAGMLADLLRTVNAEINEVRLTIAEYGEYRCAEAHRLRVEGETPVYIADSLDIPLDRVPAVVTAGHAMWRWRHVTMRAVLDCALSALSALTCQEGPIGYAHVIKEELGGLSGSTEDSREYMTRWALATLYDFGFIGLTDDGNYYVTASRTDLQGLRDNPLNVWEVADHYTIVEGTRCHFRGSEHGFGVYARLMGQSIEQIVTCRQSRQEERKNYAN